jgi:hypothetical protein
LLAGAKTHLAGLLTREARRVKAFTYKLTADDADQTDPIAQPCSFLEVRPKGRCLHEGMKFSEIVGHMTLARSEEIAWALGI